MRAFRVLPIVLLLALGIAPAAAATTSVDIVASGSTARGIWRSGRVGTCSWQRLVGVAAGRALLVVRVPRAWGIPAQ